MTETDLAALSRAATPGPWNAPRRTKYPGKNGYRYAICASDDPRGLVMLASVDSLPSEERTANARHIAAWYRERALAALAVIATARLARDHGDHDAQHTFDAALAAWDALP
jgi:hypothetical protein